ncbi:MAG: phage terminase large subunit family protein [Patescibacteria group bacterium]|nr:phage terminase large subunit family protein [Patescibacteria group bacterium]
MEKSARSSILAWIEKEKILTETGEPFDFIKEFGFLADVYLDNSPFICARKAAQVGFTTYEIIRSIWEAKRENIDIIYVLPTADDVKKFSGGKTNRIIARSPVLQELVKDKDSVEQKQIGEATIYYQGSWTERTALMISAKKLVVDELDRCKSEVVEQYDSRLQAVPNPRKAFFSNPSIPDFGISKIYEQSDQKKWHITHSCGETYVMDESCVDYEAEIYRCPKCEGEITDLERIRGDWVATGDKNAKWSGYWIPLWIKPSATAAQIAEYKREKSPEYFANFVAGLPYVGGGDKVAASTITNCLSLTVNLQEEPIIIGVDTGLPIHIVCANKQGFFYYDTLPMPTAKSSPYDDLENLLKRWKRSIIISDQGGDLIGIRELQAKYPGRVFLCYYRRDKSGIQMIDWGRGDEYGRVVVDRNRMIQLFVDEMLDRRITFNGTESEWQPYISHWMNIYRVWVPLPGEDRLTGRKEFRWERNGDDHFCFIAGTKITTIKGEVPIEDVRVNDLVLTRKGFKRVYHGGITKTNTQVLTVYFSNGSYFTATPDHPLLTRRGSIRLDSSVYGDIVYSCHNQKVLYTKGLLTAVTQSPHEGREESISSRTELSGLRGLFGFTNKYGLIPLALFLRGLSFTTKMAIRLIIKSQTWSVNRGLSTKATTQKIGFEIPLTEQRKRNTWARLESYRTRGARHLWERSGIGIMLSKVLCWLNPRVLFVLSAITRVIHEVELVVNSVPPDVVIVGLHENTEKKDVINIAVEGEAEYFANSILVKNCHASVYARVGLDRFSETMAKIVGEGVFDDLPSGQVIETDEKGQDQTRVIMRGFDEDSRWI